MDVGKLTARAHDVLRTELAAINELTKRIDHKFIKACEILLHCKGRVIVTGMGKSGHIANKIAATLASTGTPAFFVHPGEASHGDIGMIVTHDVVLALSNSGNTPEILVLLPYLQRLNILLISLTGNASSLIAQAATVNLDVSVAKEACPLDLAPTASTTTTLVMGDMLAIALLEARGFTREDFALSHPGGVLGKRLLLRVSDLMHKNQEIPVVFLDTILKDALLEINHKKLGMTTVVDQHQHLKGIFTDGDLRRSLDKNINIHTTKISTIMTSNTITISPDTLVIDALNLMEKCCITNLVIIDETNIVKGILHMHDLLQAGVI